MHKVAPISGHETIAHNVKYASYKEIRTVHIIRGSMFINIQHKVPVVAFHTNPAVYVYSVSKQHHLGSRKATGWQLVGLCS